MKQSQKDKIYELICNNKFRIFNRKNKEELFINFLEKNNLKFNFNITIENVISYLKNVNTKCCISNCNNRRIFLGIRNDNRTEFGFRKYCSCNCEYIGISLRQLGENNTCHRMTEETFNSMRKKNSIKMKQNIRDGKFIPNVTNSWAKSRCNIIFNRDDKIIKMKTRSTWEAYFQLHNTNLIYEKIVIPYDYLNETFNYIVDFVDYENKILYEIKPLSNIDDIKVKVKASFAIKWCVNNNYKYIIIDDKWFINNFKEELLIGQPDEIKMIKNLKQFKKYEN